MFPYSYGIARMIHRYFNLKGVESQRELNKYLSKNIGLQSVLFSIHDYRCKLYDLQSVNVNLPKFTGMIYVGERGSGKTYTLVGAMLEYSLNNDSSKSALFTYETDLSKGLNGYKSWFLMVLDKMIPPNASYHIIGNTIHFSNGSVVDVHSNKSDISKINIDFGTYDFLCIEESKYQKGISVESLNNLSTNGWVCVGTYEDPLNNKFVSSCLDLHYDVRFATVYDNRSLSKFYFEEVSKVAGIFSNPRK